MSRKGEDEDVSVGSKEEVGSSAHRRLAFSLFAESELENEASVESENEAHSVADARRYYIAKELKTRPLPVSESPPVDDMAGPFTDLLWKHKLVTATYCLVFWSFGMGVAFLGPTLLDLGCRTGTVFSTISWIFFAQTLFILLGSASGGFLVSRFPKHVVLLVSMSFMGLTLAIIPFCTQLTPLALTLALMGYFMGTIDTVANLSMLQLYHRRSGPFLQALHFFYGLGAFLAPLIVEPFLLNVDCTAFIDLQNNSTATDLHSSVPRSVRNDTGSVSNREAAVEHSHVQFAFWIMAGLQVPVMVLVLSLVIKDNVEKKQNERKRESFEIVDKHHIQPAVLPEVPETVDEEESLPVTLELIIVITGLAALILFLLDGLQATYGSYIYSFAIKAVPDIVKSGAAYLNAVFWGCFALGRLLSIPIATRLSPHFMLVSNLLGCLAGIVLLLLFYQSHVMLFIGTAVVGTFLSSVYPTCISLAESYVDLTPSITTTIVVSAAAGETLMPVIVGHEFDKFGTVSFLVTCVILTLLSIAVHFILYLVGCHITRYAASPGIMGPVTALVKRLTPFSKSEEENEESGVLQRHVKFYSRMKSETSEASLSGEANSSTDIQLSLKTSS